MRNILFLFGMPKANGYLGGIAFIINKYLSANELFKEKGYEVSLYNTSHDDLGVSFSILSKITSITNAMIQAVNVPKQVKHIEKDGMVIHMHSSRKWTLLKDLFVAKRIRQVFGGKMVLSIHFAEANNILYKNNLLREFQLDVLRTVFDNIIFLSKSTYDEFIELGISKNKAKLLYTFHDFSYNNIVFENNDKYLNLLFVGSLDQRKGILDLLQSLKPIDGSLFRLNVCGKFSDKNIENEYNKIATDFGESVIFHGYVQGEKKESLFKEADVLVLPSYGEGMPIVIMEALASGTGVISTNVGAIPEIITEKNGDIIEPGDIIGLTSCISKYIEDRDRLAEIKKYNFEYGKKFALESNIEMLSKIYGE